MGLKEKLQRLRSRLLESISSKNEEASASSKSQLAEQNLGLVYVETLDTKVDNFIAWYSENLVKDYYPSIGEYSMPRELRNLIEKIAVWYELRYPNYLVSRLIPAKSYEEKDVSTSMFDDNSYINEQLEKDSEVRILDWESFYNFDAFLNSLPCEEKRFFEPAQYDEVVYLSQRTGAHLHLDKKGYVEMAEGISMYLNFQVADFLLRGVHVKRIAEMLKQSGYQFSADNELEKTIRYVDNWELLRSGILDCAMYRIIERGGRKIGPRRGLLFAKEFKRDISVPMMYGIDTLDSNLRVFTTEYLKAGGSKNLTCYENYFSRESEEPYLFTTNVSEILSSTRYTEEEDTLHQRLVSALAFGIDPISLKKEQAKQLRIERKLAKSRRNR